MNIELIQKVYDQVLLEPESHDQKVWLDVKNPADPTGCGTTACVAGWAVILGAKIDFPRSRHVLWYDVIYLQGAESQEHVHTIASRLLGIGEETAFLLFRPYIPREQVLKALETALKTDNEDDMFDYLCKARKQHEH